MSNTNIWVEGEADKKFINDYCKLINSPIHTNIRIEITGGWTQISSEKTEGERIRNAIKINRANQEKNIIIFDADENPEKRRNEIEEWKTKYNLDFDLFLFPDNKSKGELEDLLEQIITEKNSDIFECWREYEKCLKTKSNSRLKPLTIPAKKSKIYCYIETLVGTSNSEKEKIKDRNRDFLNTEHWQLDSVKLFPLKNFLLKSFIIEC